MAMEPRETMSDTSGADDAASSNNSSAVQVAVRVRPLSAGESAQGSEACVSVLGDQNSVLVGGLSGKQYDFDAAFPPEIPQSAVYDALVMPLVDRFFDGYNATVFAYGQTGSGKTFTMGNEFKLSVAQADRGIIPRTMDEIFKRIAHSSQDDTKYVLKVSYLEILNEEIHDLLAPSASSAASLSVRDDGKRGICVNGLSEHAISTLDQVATLLHTGALSRATAATTMNAQSSRSHAICTLTMEQFTSSMERGTEAKFAKFHLVDLAGSERAKRTNAEGARFKEGVNINKGLLSLGNVINALSERQAHVPYRDSKLTRLLQDSLGGNSKTLMIACISPADVNFEETCNTLRYAARARNIQNQAVVNQTLSAENQVNYLKQQLEVMQLQLLQQQQNTTGGGTGLSSTGSVSSFEVEILEKEIQRWKSIARTREDELQLVMSAKDKWKKIADEFMNKKHQTQRSGMTSGAVRVAHSTSTTSGGDCYSPKSKAMLQDAIEFDKSVQVTKFAPATPAKATTGNENENESETDAGDSEAAAVVSWENDIDSLEDVIKEKEKIVLALSQASGSSDKHGPLTALSKGYETKIRELESQVARLAEEKRRLAADKLAGKTEASATNSSGESPQRRLQTQLQQVQSQLQVARHAEKECKRLSQLWKSGSLKISTLEREIVDMKKQKATLQRQLKDESESHRKEKREQNLKIVQLKRQEQRKQYELQKLTTLHVKQNGVLKRKNEEIAAVNKRMRSMVQTQQQAQQMRMHSSKNRSSAMATGARTMPAQAKTADTASTNDGDAMAAITKALKESLDVQMTIVGAKNAIQMELDDRKNMALQIARMESQSETSDTTAIAKLDELKRALKEKNADIRMLQQKLASVEKNNALPSALLPGSVGLCHKLIRQLMDTVFESKTATLELENYKADLDAAEDQLVEQAQRHEEIVASYKKQLQRLGHFDEVTVAVEDTSELEKLQNELKEMRAELETARAQAATATIASSADRTKQNAPVKKKKKSAMTETVDLVEILSSSDDDDDEEEDDDSDYIEEEDTEEGGVSKRMKKTTKKINSSSSGGAAAGAGRVRQPLKPRAPDLARDSGFKGGNAMDEINLLLSKPSAVGGTICCSCNGKCATKSCACRAEKQSCGPECSCKETKCHNRGDAATMATTTTKKQKRRSDPLANDKENEVESFFATVTDKENFQPMPTPLAVLAGDDKENAVPTTTTTNTTKFKKLWSNGSSGGSFLAKPVASSSSSSSATTSFAKNHNSTAISRFF